MIQVSSILQSYPTFINTTISNRFFKHSDLIQLLENLNSNTQFSILKAGQSFEGRSINLIRCGEGSIKVFLWSQMHGNEPTATMALLDLLNFLENKDQKEISNSILRNCTLYILPMLNPDGTEIFERRNAQKIDINRDFLSQQSPEGRLLRSLRDEIQPEFGFNLHDQTNLWSAGSSGNPATISLLAPAFDASLSVNTVRQKAMQIIVEMNETLQEIIPKHVGRFDDEYEPRAFGDNFQAADTSTILIEAGGYAEDTEKQYIRKLVFIAIVQGLYSIAKQSFINKKIEDYFAIPDNKLHHFQILLRNCNLSVDCDEAANSEQEGYRVDLGLIAKETVSENLKSMNYSYLIGDIGDLSNRFGYKVIDCKSFKLIQTNKIKIEEAANFVLMDGLEVLLTFENGVITNSNI